MLDIFWFYMTLTLDTIPFLALSLVLLKDRLSCSIPAAVMRLIVPVALYNAAICVTFMNGMYDAQLMVVFRLLSCVLSYFLLCLTFKGYYLQLAFKCLFTLPYMLGVLNLAAFCINFIDARNMPDFMAITCLRLLFYIIFAYPYYRMEKDMFGINLEMTNTEVWRYFAISQCILDLAMMVSLRSDYAENGIPGKAFALQMIMVFASLSVSLILFYALKLERNMYLNRDKQMRNELLIELNSKQYSSIQDNLIHMKRVRHDIKHHLRTIDQMLAEGRYSEVREYLNEFEVNMPKGTSIRFCDNLTLNALLEYYYFLAENKGIQVSFDIAELAECGVNDIDLNILLGNALENAIEGCENAPVDNRKITLCAKKRAGSIFITIDNTFDGVLKNRQGVALSRKREFVKSGYGNASMDAVAQKYNGQIKREINADRYQVSIVLSEI